MINMQITGIRVKMEMIENKDVCDTHCLSEVLTICELTKKERENRDNENKVIVL